MKLIKGTDAQAVDRGFDGDVRVDASVCFDFVVSLRALYNPRTFTRSRRWTSEQLERLGDEHTEAARFLFQGFETALGYGAIRVITDLQPGAGPRDLIDAVAALPAADLAMLMLDDGEADAARLAAYREVLDGAATRATAAVAGLLPGWAARCRRVLREPDVVQAELVGVLSNYLDRVFAEQADDLTALLDDAAGAARAMLDVVPAPTVIEQLTGGYTLGEDLDLRSVTLAPSVFAHPYMSARVDQAARAALVVYGVPSAFFDGYDPVPIRQDLVTALKAMSDPNRLALLRMLAERPMYAAELAAQLRLGQPTVHHHVHRLRAAGMVRQERDRVGTRYSLRTEATAQLIRSIEDWIFGSTDRRS
ncbi:ArsR/SmtB family transcription factor [Jiangella muralis]|uniref:ArsR/SmtB family transcription factor n=1 Tax=Jiangella muralis TaxID=702383 RepID=UPI0012F99F0F|nr:metalloregulator ArsR/SmtB family transcription factor [Jiangella muralis]